MTISTVLLNVTGMYWTMFETTKRSFNKTEAEKNTFLFNFFCGSVAGSVCIGLVYFSNMCIVAIFH